MGVQFGSNDLSLREQATADFLSTTILIRPLPVILSASITVRCRQLAQAQKSFLIRSTPCSRMGLDAVACYTGSLNLSRYVELTLGIRN
jgi:hypothetical protein